MCVDILALCSSWLLPLSLKVQKEFKHALFAVHVCCVLCMYCKRYMLLFYDTIFMRNSHDLNVVNSHNLAFQVNGSDKYLPQKMFLLWELKYGTVHLGLFSTQLHILIIKTKGRQFIHDKCKCSDSTELLNCCNIIVHVPQTAHIQIHGLCAWL